MIFQVMSSEGRLRASDGQSIVSSEEKLKLETLWQKRNGPRFSFCYKNLKCFKTLLMCSSLNKCWLSRELAELVSFISESMTSWNLSSLQKISTQWQFHFFSSVKFRPLPTHNPNHIPFSKVKLLIDHTVFNNYIWR